MIPMVTDILKSHGFRGKYQTERVAGITVYSPEFFNPLDDATGILRITDNTHSIHWFMKSWMDSQSPMKVWCKRMIRRIIGKETFSRLKAYINK